MPGLAQKMPRETDAHEESRRLHAKIGRFLADQHLPANPANYALGFRYYADPQSSLAKAIRARIADGVRLTQCDIDALGVQHSALPINRAPNASLVKQSTIRRLERLKRVTLAVLREIDTIRGELPQA